MSGPRTDPCGTPYFISNFSVIGKLGNLFLTFDDEFYKSGFKLLGNI